MPSSRVRVASVNVNGIRAAFRKGMGDWLAEREVDVLALQEVRATDEIVTELFGDGWQVHHDAATAAGRAGVALVSRQTPAAVRREFGPEDFDSAGRWIEGDFVFGGTPFTVVSVYVHSGEVDTPKQVEKYRFLDTMLEVLPALASSNPLAVVAGDWNVGHRTLDIKNWKGNVKRSGFLPEERAYLDKIFGSEDEPDYNAGAGLGWVDVGRKVAGEVPGPYTWWSQRGKAFDTDTGWRIDYHAATPQLAKRVMNYEIDRAAAYDERWSDHAPVVVDYEI